MNEQTNKTTNGRQSWKWARYLSRSLRGKDRSSGFKTEGCKRQHSQRWEKRKGFTTEMHKAMPQTQKGCSWWLRGSWDAGKTRTPQTEPGTRARGGTEWCWARSTRGRSGARGRTEHRHKGTGPPAGHPGVQPCRTPPLRPGSTTGIDLPLVSEGCGSGQGPQGSGQQQSPPLPLSLKPANNGGVSLQGTAQTRWRWHVVSATRTSPQKKPPTGEERDPQSEGGRARSEETELRGMSPRL